MFETNIDSIENVRIEGDLSSEISFNANVIIRQLYKSNYISEIYSIKILKEDKEKDILGENSQLCILKDNDNKEWCLWGYENTFLLFFIPSTKDKYIAIFDIQNWLYNSLIDEEGLDDITDDFSENGCIYDVLFYKYNAGSFYADSCSACILHIQNIINHYRNNEEIIKERLDYLSHSMPFYYSVSRNSNSYVLFYSQLSNKFLLKDRIPENTIPQIKEFSEFFNYLKIDKFYYQYESLVYFDSKKYMKESNKSPLLIGKDGVRYLLIPDKKKKLTYHIYRGNRQVINAILFSVPYGFNNIHDYKDTPFFVGTISESSVIDLVQSFLDIMDPQKREDDAVLMNIEAFRYLVKSLLHLKNIRL